MQTETDPPKSPAFRFDLRTLRWLFAIGLFTLIAVVLSISWLAGMTRYQSTQAFEVTANWLALTAMLIVLAWRYQPGSSLRWVRRCLGISLVWAVIGLTTLLTQGLGQVPVHG